MAARPRHDAPSGHHQSPTLDSRVLWARTVKDTDVGPTNDDHRHTRLSRALPLDRFSAFSDGVFAIAITLLVLELPVPTGDDLLASLLEESPSPGVLHQLRLHRRELDDACSGDRVHEGGDTAAAGLNLLTLLFIALLPFATSLMVSNIGGPDERVAVLVYGINVLIASVMLTLLIAYLVRSRAAAGRRCRRDGGRTDSAAQISDGSG